METDSELNKLILTGRLMSTLKYAVEDYTAFSHTDKRNAIVAQHLTFGMGSDLVPELRKVVERIAALPDWQWRPAIARAAVHLIDSEGFIDKIIYGEWIGK